MQIKLSKNLILSVFKPFYICPSFATTLYKQDRTFCKKTTFDLMFLMSMLNRQKNRPRIYKRRIILLISYELKFKKHFIFISSLAFNFNIAFYYSGVVKISKFYMTLCIYMLYVSFVSVSLKTTHLS